MSADLINHPRVRVKRSMPWAQRRPVARRCCRVCSTEFQPSCGGHFYCEPCSIERRRSSHTASMGIWRNNNRAHTRRVKANWDLKRFSLTIEQYEAMASAQHGCCAICGIKPTGGRGVLRKLAVDHCHTTNRVRGLLCAPCNTAIGLLKESLATLQSASDYLLKHSEGANV